MPVFPGGDEALIKFIAKNVKYPENAKQKGIQGRVLVQFIVKPDLSIDKVSIKKGVDPDLDKEAIRVVSALPAFEKPGIIGGKPVPVWFMLPINFTLQ
jgi:protein TonB